MVTFLASLLTKALLWLSSLLPASPFRSVTLAQGVETGLGWLNWVFPVGPCMELMVVWLGLLWISVVVRWNYELVTGTAAKAASMG